MKIIIDTQTYSGLLQLTVVTEANLSHQSEEKLSYIIGPAIGGLIVKSNADDSAIGITLNMMNDITPGLVSLENVVDENDSPIGDISAVINKLKPFL